MEGNYHVPGSIFAALPVEWGFFKDGVLKTGTCIARLTGPNQSIGFEKLTSLAEQFIPVRKDSSVKDSALTQRHTMKGTRREENDDKVKLHLQRSPRYGVTSEQPSPFVLTQPTRRNVANGGQNARSIVTLASGQRRLHRLDFFPNYFPCTLFFFISLLIILKAIL